MRPRASNRDRRTFPTASPRALSEREAQRIFAGRANIVRPGLIIGPEDETDRFTYWPVRIHRGGEVLAPGDGSDTVQIIDVRDLTEWMIRMAETGHTGEYNGIGPATPRPHDGAAVRHSGGDHGGDDVHLGRHRLPHREGNAPVPGDAGVAAAGSRIRGLRALRPDAGGGGRAHLPSPRRDGARYARVPTSPGRRSARPTCEPAPPRSREAEVLAAWHRRRAREGLGLLVRTGIPLQPPKQQQERGDHQEGRARHGGNGDEPEDGHVAPRSREPRPRRGPDRAWAGTGARRGRRRWPDQPQGVEWRTARSSQTGAASPTPSTTTSGYMANL